MIRQIQITSDNSLTIYQPDLDETYHSKNGALTESMHVFIDKGFNEIIKHKKTVNIFEVGFGTGLNTILTIIEAFAKNIVCNYQAIEAFPLDIALINELKYKTIIPQNFNSAFQNIHSVKWDEEFLITDNFKFKKTHAAFEHYKFEQPFDLIYFDAFAPEKQPELWTEEIFKKIYNSINEGGILVTYSSKGEVKRNLRSAGFFVERLDGPPGKRHMVRARK